VAGPTAVGIYARFFVTQPVDDPTVLDADPLWRRLHPEQYVDDGQGGKRISTAAFENSSDGTGMSVSLGREAAAEGIDPALALKRYPGFGMASITAGICRAHNQGIERDPTEEDRHHAVVNGVKTKSTRKALAKIARLLILPQ
jgi:hypothetical protein